MQMGNAPAEETSKYLLVPSLLRLIVLLSTKAAPLCARLPWGPGTRRVGVMRQSTALHITASHGADTRARHPAITPPTIPPAVGWPRIAAVKKWAFQWVQVCTSSVCWPGFSSCDRSLRTAPPLRGPWPIGKDTIHTYREPLSVLCVLPR